MGHPRAEEAPRQEGVKFLVNNHSSPKRGLLCPLFGPGNRLRGQAQPQEGLEPRGRQFRPIFWDPCCRLPPDSRRSSHPYSGRAPTAGPAPSPSIRCCCQPGLSQARTGCREVTQAAKAAPSWRRRTDGKAGVRLGLWAPMGRPSWLPLVLAKHRGTPRTPFRPPPAARPSSSIQATLLRAPLHLRQVFLGGLKLPRQVSPPQRTKGSLAGCAEVSQLS